MLPSDWHSLLLRWATGFDVFLGAGTLVDALRSLQEAVLFYRAPALASGHGPSASVAIAVGGTVRAG